MTVYNLTGTGGVAEAEVDPISRIEGHLGVRVQTDASNIVVDANAHGNLWRGFENFLLGRAANDAITFTQRICGVCPVPHGMTSTYAIDSVLGYSEGHITFKSDANGYGVPAKAVLIRNLVLSAEFLMSSITHFYHLAAPSYVQGPAMPPWTPYANGVYATALENIPASRGAGSAAPGAVPDVSGTAKLWDAVILSYVRALRIRRLTFEAGALFAGRMPMTSCYVAGGVTMNGTEDLSGRCAKFKELIREVGAFIVKEYVPIALALGALYPTFDSQTGGTGIGAGLGRFLAWGAFPNLDDTLTLPGGVLDTTAATDDFQVLDKADVKAMFLAGGTNAVPDNLKEDIANSRYASTFEYESTDAAYPGSVSRTEPDRSSGYSYMKAPRWDGQPCEVGPFARLAVAGYYPVDGRYLADVVPGYATVYTTITAHPGTDVDEATALSVFKLGAVADSVVTGLSNSGLAGAVVQFIVNLKGGLSTMDRLRARALESLVLVQAMVGSITTDGSGNISWANDGWIDELDAITDNTVGSTWTQKFLDGGEHQGWGGTEAPRGALMHQVTIKNGKIQKYQCIVPTTWNGSPKCSNDLNGAIEAACIGAPYTTATEVNVLRIAQSFDPCIACAVH